MSATPGLLGAVLAGGRSRRFGRDKSSAIVGGATLLARAAGTLSEVFQHVVVVSSVPRSGPWTTVPDLRADGGPLAGIEAALAAAEARDLDGVFVLACDLPLVTAGTVRALALVAADAPAVAPARDGFPSVEPLCAAYDTSCSRRARELLDRGRAAAHELFHAVAGVRVPLPMDEFLNVNTAADLERAERILSDRAR